MSWGEGGRGVRGAVRPRGCGGGRNGLIEAPGHGDRGSGGGAEAEGFEPSMEGKAQTALAVRRHRPD